MCKKICRNCINCKGMFKIEIDDSNVLCICSIHDEYMNADTDSCNYFEDKNENL